MAIILLKIPSTVSFSSFSFPAISVHSFKFSKRLIIGLLLLVAGVSVNGATRTASVNGNWSNTATWGGAAVPISTDDVLINSGIAVTMDLNPGNCNNLTINGTLTLSGSTNLNVSGNLTNNGAFTAGTGTVTMNHSDATGMIIGGTASTTFNNLYLGTSSGQSYTLGNNETVTGVLTISNNVILTLGTNNLMLGASATIVNTGTLYNGCMIIADGSGKLQKTYIGFTSFTFPIGDSSSNYSPITLSFTAGTFGVGASVSVNVTKAKEPHNISPTNYFNRYWTVSQAGITSFVCNVTGTFGNSDISGSWNLQNSVEYTSAWINYSGISTTPSPYSFTANGVTAFGNFTAMGLPSFTITNNPITGLTYASGHGPSTGGQSFYVNSANLTSPFIVTASTDFEISADNITYLSTPITLPQSGGVVNNAPVYVRLKAGLPVGTYSNENIVCSSAGASNINVVVSGTVTPSAYYSIATSNWTTNTTWAFNSGGSAVPAGAYPQAGDNVYIERGYAVTVNLPNAACSALTLGGQNNTGTLTFAATGSPALTVSGAVQVSNTDNTNSNGVITFASGSSMTAGSLMMGNVNNTAGSTLTMTAGGTLTMNGAFTLGNGPKTWTPGSGTVIMNATNTLPATVFTPFNNLTCSSGTTTMGLGIALNGNLNIGNGAILTDGSYSLTVAGTTVIGSGSSGTLNVAGAKTFTGTVTINSGASIYESTSAPLVFGSDVINNGTLTENGNAVVGFAGSLTNNGTYSASTGTHTFSGTTKTIGGTNTISIPTAIFNGNYTNNGNLTVGTQLTVSGVNILKNNGTITISTTPLGTGGLTQGTTGILNLGGTSGITNLTANAVGNTVNYNGTGQTVNPINYYNLSLSGSGTKAISSSISIAGNLSISVTKAGLTNGINVTTNGLTLEGISKTYGTWGSSSSAATNKDDTHFTATTGIVTVTDNRLATVFSGLTASQSTCIGTPVTLSGVVSATGPVYPANGEIVVVIINGNSQNAVIAGGAGGFSISFPTTTISTGSNTITYSYGGNASLKGVVDNTTSLTGFPNLPVSISIGASSNSICSGTSVTFTATPTNGGTTPSYQWKVNGTSAGTNSSTYSYTPANTDAVTCVLTSNASPCATGTPATSNTVTMSVSPISNNTIVYTNGLNGSACGTAAENSNLVLTAPPGAIFISVDFASYGTPNGDCTNGFTLGDCNQINSQSITQGYLLGNNTATIPATNTVFVDPCEGTLKRLYVKASYLKPICMGDTPGPITGAAPSGGNGSYTYYWESSTTSSSSGFVAAAGTNNVQNYSPGALTQTTWYRRTVTTGGCSDTSVPIQISVNQILPASVTIVANPTGTICSGTSVTFTATPVNGGTTTTYQWTLNGSNVGTNSPTYTTTTLANGNAVACIMTSNLSCTTNNPATSNTVTMTVNPVLPVSISITASATSVCPGTSVSFTATPSNGGTTPSYQWQVNGINEGSNLATYTYTPVNNDVVTCVLTSNYPCTTSGNTATSNAVTMVVYAQIANNFFDFSTGPYTTVCATTAEHVNAILTAAAGNVFVNVGFASYGTPTGSCLAFVINPTCNATTSQSVTESYLLGNNTASIPTENTTYGDPCPGTFKNYDVQATYSTPVCSGNSPGTINGLLPTGGSGAYTYLWQSSTTSSTTGFVNAAGTNNGQNYAPGNLTQTTWYRRIVYSGSCSNTSSVIQITVSPLLPVTVSIAPSANPVYAGTSVTYTATPVNGGTTPAYQWKVNGSPVGSSSNIYTYFPVNGDAVTCFLTSNGTPCTTGSPALSNTVTMTVNSNKWKGNSGTLWNTGTNWLGGFAPVDGYDVEFDTNATNDLYLDTNHTIGNLTNTSSKRLFISTGKCLTINGTVNTNSDPTKIYIQSGSSVASGSLIFTTTLPVYATVEMYSQASKGSGITVDSTTYYYSWQYFGIPLNSVAASPTFDGSFVRSYAEGSTVTDGKWTQLGNLSVLSPFAGYEITQISPKTIIYSGILVNSSNTIQLTNTSGAYDPGQNIISNPYTAAINIPQIIFGGNTEATVYLYNTGSFGQWSTNSGETTNSSSTILAGQYLAIPQYAAGTGTIPTDIPSMSGFLVKATTTGANGSITINYNSTAIIQNVHPQRAPSQVKQTSDNVYLEIDLKGERTGDCMWLINHPGTTHGFDNGWDGYKLSGALGTPQLFAVEESGNYQVSTSSDMSNTYLGFQAGLDLEDTLTFYNENLLTQYAGIYLEDLIANKVIDISNSGTQYAFVTDNTPAPVKRFMIVTNPTEVDPVTSTHLKVFNSGNTVFIQNSGNLNGEMKVYDMMGRNIKRSTFSPYGVTAVKLETISGAYIIKAATDNERVTKKIIF